MAQALALTSATAVDRGDGKEFAHLVVAGDWDGDNELYCNVELGGRLIHVWLTPQDAAKLMAHLVGLILKHVEDN